MLGDFLTFDESVCAPPDPGRTLDGNCTCVHADGPHISWSDVLSVFGPFTVSHKRTVNKPLAGAKDYFGGTIIVPFTVGKSLRN